MPKATEEGIKQVSETISKAIEREIERVKKMNNYVYAEQDTKPSGRIVLEEEAVVTVRKGEGEAIHIVVTPVGDQSREWKITLSLEEALEVKNGLSDVIRRMTVVL